VCTCANEWVRDICGKPWIKCAECPRRRFLPVTDDLIRWHLSGHDDARQPFVVGVYPLGLDETCFFLAVDFDKANCREDANADLLGGLVSSPEPSSRPREVTLRVPKTLTKSFRTF
jgi:hypothetical protein